jgi:hypothetical protein
MFQNAWSSGLVSMAGIGGGAALLGSAYGSGNLAEGALGGAALGLGIDALLYPSLAAMGPVGWAIAGVTALAGLLAAIFGRGAAKQKAASTEQTYEFAADDIFTQFKNFQIDYSSALSGMQALIQQGVAAEAASGTGSAGTRGASNLTMVIDNEIKALNDLQSQRQLNATAMGAMTVPEYAVGGQIGGLPAGFGSGARLIIAHDGEYVLRKDAVQAVGTEFLSALNQMPRFAGGGIIGGSMPVTSRVVNNNITMHVHPQRGMSDQEAAHLVTRGWKLAVRNGAI